MIRWKVAEVNLQCVKTVDEMYFLQEEKINECFVLGKKVGLNAQEQDQEKW